MEQELYLRPSFLQELAIVCWFVERLLMTGLHADTTDFIDNAFINECMPRYRVFWSRANGFQTMVCGAKVHHLGVQVLVDYWVYPDPRQYGLCVSVTSPRVNRTTNYTRASVTAVIREFLPSADWRPLPADWFYRDYSP